MNKPKGVLMPVWNIVANGSGGGGTYVKELTAAIERTGQYEVTSLVSEAGVNSTSGLELKIPGVKGGTGVLRRATSHLTAAYAAKTLRGRAEDCDIIHYPLTAKTPTWRQLRTPIVQTVHDMQHVDFPQYFTTLERAYRNRYYLDSLASAQGVIAISEFTRERLLASTNLSPDRVRVVHQGVSEEFTPLEVERQNFVYYPASAAPHKNHHTLFAAFEAVRRVANVELVLSGGNASTFGPLPEGTRHLGWVSSARRLELYRTAASLVFPSLYEGFGMPPLEAMACGTNVISSSAGSLPEVCGNAATFFDPHDSDSLAELILESVAKKQHVNVAGIERSHHFSWKKTASLTMEFYDHLIEGA